MINNMEEETNPNKLTSIFFNFKFRLFLTIFVFLALLLSLALFLLNFSTKSNKSSETKASVTPSQRTDSTAENKEVLRNILIKVILLFCLLFSIHTLSKQISPIMRFFLSLKN